MDARDWLVLAEGVFLGLLLGLWLCKRGIVTWPRREGSERDRVL